MAFINPKLGLFVRGRKETISRLRSKLSKEDRIVWLHAASLGEYEQGLPVMEAIKQEYPSHKIVLTFFSPSGFEVKKNTPSAVVVCYLPLDTKRKVEEFLDTVHPVLAIFVKYEIWPNYLRALKSRNVPTLLISALFKQNQIYFKWYGSFMRNALTNFTHIFVQNKASKELLKGIALQNVTISGDTRFDRVSKIADRDNALDFMERFKKDSFCLVVGSSWPEDEKIIADYINSNTLPIKFVIAPHTINPKHISNIEALLKKSVVRHSELQKANLENHQVLIVDTIGLLTKIYSYADLAYVGGGFATGLHNTLEPAVFGIPVIIGPKFEGFAEAERLVLLKGILSIKNTQEFETATIRFFTDKNFREKTGAINAGYIQKNKGATPEIMKKVNELLQ